MGSSLAVPTMPDPQLPDLCQMRALRVSPEAWILETPDARPAFREDGKTCATLQNSVCGDGLDHFLWDHRFPVLEARVLPLAPEASDGARGFCRIYPDPAWPLVLASRVPASVEIAARLCDGRCGGGCGDVSGRLSVMALVIRVQGPGARRISRSGLSLHFDEI